MLGNHHLQACSLSCSLVLVLNFLYDSKSIRIVGKRKTDQLQEGDETEILEQGQVEVLSSSYHS